MLRTIVVLCLVVLSGGCASTRKADVAPEAAQAMRMEVVPLQFAAAQELAAVLSELEDASTTAVAQRGCAGLRAGSDAESLRPPETRTRCLADTRTNSLIVVAARQEDLSRVLELIARLDVEAKKSP